MLNTRPLVVMGLSLNHTIADPTVLYHCRTILSERRSACT